MPRRRRRPRPTGFDAVAAVAHRVLGPAGLGWERDDAPALGLLSYLSPESDQPRRRVVLDVVDHSVTVWRGRRSAWMQPHPDPDTIAAELAAADKGDLAALRAEDSAT